MVFRNLAILSYSDEKNQRSILVVKDVANYFSQKDFAIFNDPFVNVQIKMKVQAYKCSMLSNYLAMDGVLNYNSYG